MTKPGGPVPCSASIGSPRRSLLPSTITLSPPLTAPRCASRRSPYTRSPQRTVAASATCVTSAHGPRQVTLRISSRSSWSPRAGHDAPASPVSETVGGTRHCANHVVRGASAGFELALCEDWRGRLAFALQACPCAEQRATRGSEWCELHHPDRARDVVVDRLDAAPRGVRLVPEAGPAGVAKEVLPPAAMRFGARPRFQALVVAPVLPHTAVARREPESLMGEKAVGAGPRSLVDLRPEPEQTQESAQAIDTHPEVDNDEI